ncbi:MAG: hypothetical protein ACK56J_11250 [Planctomycetota bacterium]|jgi:hypothetical protein
MSSKLKTWHFLYSRLEPLVSLFEDDMYVYRDTFFVLFERGHRPAASEVRAALASLGKRYELDPPKTEERAAGQNSLESFTLRSPYDFSAMDITYVEGAEVQQQVRELIDEFKTMTLAGDEARKLSRLAKCDARFDIFHFEQVDSAAEDDDQMDPGGLLLVMEKLAQLTKGVGLDPQSLSLM